MSGSIHIDKLIFGGAMFATDNLPRPLAAVAGIRWATGYVDSVGHGIWVLLFWAVVAPRPAVRLFTREEK